MRNFTSLAVPITLALSLTALAFNAHSKVTEEEAAALGDTLTPLGAIKAANEAGTIPEWTGGISSDQLPEGFDRDGTGYTLPFADDSPLYTITGQNITEYRPLLSAGHQKLLESYSSYKMVVYPSHRTAAYPQEIYDSTIKNATNAELGSSGSLINAELGVPFPIPQNGLEPIWNHKVRYRGDTVVRFNNQAVVGPQGIILRSKRTERVRFVYGNIEDPGYEDNINLYYVSKLIAPPKDAGQVTLVHEYVSEANGATRKAWLYNRGQRRVRLAPNVQFDFVPQGTDGQQYSDQVDMFNGSQDLYTWKLLGKKEMIIPYNSYKLNSKEVTYDQILKGKHIDQDLARYELHRVWVVDANLKDDKNHPIAGRTFYIDEDSWSITMVDCRDTRGNLWRFQEGHLAQIYDVPLMTTVPEIIYDFTNGKYFATALINEDRSSAINSDDVPSQIFSPQYMSKLKD